MVTEGFARRNKQRREVAFGSITLRGLYNEGNK
jgi:hypothetical protein